MTIGNAMLEQSEERALVNALFESLDAQPRVLFPQKGKRISAPLAHGVYVICAPDGTVVHVGRTVTGQKGLSQRLGNHVNGKSSFARGYLKGKTEELRSSFTFQYIEVFDDRERALLEHFATAWHCPARLGLGRGSSYE